MQKIEDTLYAILEIPHHAPLRDIKLAYRKLVKQYHPDTRHKNASHEAIARLNVAYETLSNPQARANYDRSMGIQTLQDFSERTIYAEQLLRRRASSHRSADEKLTEWVQRVYEPIANLLSQILSELNGQIDALADDPFDDDLMADFLTYLDHAQHCYHQAQQCFRRYPNPVATASVAEYLYHCLNQLGDGIEELRYFTTNFDDRHLHTGMELWRIAEEMYQRAQEEMLSC